MARKKSTPKRTNHVPAGHTAKEQKDLESWLGSFRNMHGRLFEQISALQCVLRTIRSSKATEVDDDLGAAESLLQRTVCELNRLHNELDYWKGDTAYGRTWRLSWNGDGHARCVEVRAEESDHSN